jgi:aldose 1-epimerase
MLLSGCKSKNANSFKIEKSVFGKTADGTVVYLYTLSNSNDMTVKITNYGGIVNSILVPDKNGKIGDVVLGFDSLSSYETKSPYFGALIGRYGNRIAKGKFTLDGNDYQLPTNDGPNSLHGGTKGFDKRVWEPKEIMGPDSVGLELTYLSKDGEEGYPGNLKVRVEYSLNNNNELRIDYHAVTDKKTIVNLTHHSYFNLKDDGKSDIYSHLLKINADYYTPIDSTLIPTGEIVPVENTPFDFRNFTPIGKRIHEDNQQLKFAGGYDHNFVLRGKNGEMKMAAEVKEDSTGRTLEVWTDQPGLQFYSGNFLNGTLIGKYGIKYVHRSAFCLESQHFPDSPNEPKFPSTVLNPGDTYHTTTIYKFGVEGK